MLFLTFLYALSVLAMGAMGLAAAGSPEEARSLATPGFFFGGATLLCAFFALREPRHGLAGASFLAFLAASSSIPAIAALASRSQAAWGNPPFMITTATFGLSLLYLAGAVHAWQKYRRKPRNE